jgi:hypothetical protein
MRAEPGSACTRRTSSTKPRGEPFRDPGQGHSRGVKIVDGVVGRRPRELV